MRRYAPDGKQPTNLNIDEILDTDIDPYNKSAGAQVGLSNVVVSFFFLFFLVLPLDPNVRVCFHVWFAKP